MLKKFKYILSKAISESFKGDKDSENDFYLFFKNKMGNKIYFSGSFMRREPDFILGAVVYNLSLIVTKLILFVLTALTLKFRRNELLDLYIVVNFSAFILVAFTLHVQALINRRKTVRFGENLLKRERTDRYDRMSSDSRMIFKTFAKFWPYMISSTWFLFFIGSPIYSYVFYNSIALPISLTFPFNTHNVIGFLTSYVFEMYAGFAFCVQMITNVPTFAYIYNLLISEYKVLVSSVASLHEDSTIEYYKKWDGRPPSSGQNTLDLYRDPEFVVCLTRCFKHIMDHHRSILRLQECVQAISCVPLTVILGLDSLIMAATGSLLVTVKDKELSLKIVLIGFLIMTGSFIWLICFAGQQIKTLGEKVREELYLTNWYDWPEGMKRSLRIMMARTLRPPVITCCYLDIRPNYSLFATMMTSVYLLMTLQMAFNHFHLY